MPLKKPAFKQALKCARMMFSLVSHKTLTINTGSQHLEQFIFL